MNGKDELDRLLDNALKDYSAFEPRPGLEQRVIANLRSAPEPAAAGWLRWAAVAAACTLVAALALWFRLETRSGRPATPAAVSAPAAQRPTEIAAGPGPKPARLHAPALSSRPHRPAASRAALSGPLSQQERALLALVRIAPRSATAGALPQESPEQRVFVAQVQVPLLAVQPVEVAPLEK